MTMKTLIPRESDKIAMMAHDAILQCISCNCYNLVCHNYSELSKIFPDDSITKITGDHIIEITVKMLNRAINYLTDISMDSGAMYFFCPDNVNNYGNTYKRKLHYIDYFDHDDEPPYGIIMVKPQIRGLDDNNKWIFDDELLSPNITPEISGDLLRLLCSSNDDKQLTPDKGLVANVLLFGTNLDYYSDIMNIMYLYVMGCIRLGKDVVDMEELSTVLNGFKMQDVIALDMFLELINDDLSHMPIGLFKQKDGKITELYAGISFSVEYANRGVVSFSIGVNPVLYIKD